MNSAQLINQDSGDVEYGTPGFITDAARAVMGGIELDPASALWANESVGAERIFAKADSALCLPWVAKTLWMNHPFSRDGNPKWIDKLVVEFTAGRVDRAMCITFAATSEAWFRPLYRFPMCFLSPRTNYYLPDGSKKVGVTKGSVVTYLCRTEKQAKWFDAIFNQYGAVKL